MPDKDYQHKRRNRYWMEPARYKMALAYVRQYPRLCRMRDEILNGSPSRTEGVGIQKGRASDPTAQRAISLSRIEGYISVVDKALNRIPKDYRQAVMDNILYRINREAVGFKHGMGGSTVQEWRARFLWEVAEIAKIP